MTLLILWQVEPVNLSWAQIMPFAVRLIILFKQATVIFRRLRGLVLFIMTQQLFIAKNNWVDNTGIKKQKNVSFMTREYQ